MVDTRLQAGRGEDFSAARKRREIDELAELANLDDDDFRLPMDHRIEDGMDWSATQRISLAEPLPAHNLGYRLLERMGWRGGGLGARGQGRAEPIPLEAGDNGVRAGLGRGEVDSQYTSVSSRRALEVEMQADEDEGRRIRREAESERVQLIREEVVDILRTFFCEICNKQYQTAMQLDEHLSSYDHHHRKRMAETHAMLAARGKKDRDRRRRKEADRELAALTEQSLAAARAAGLSGAAPPSHPAASGPETASEASLPHPPSTAAHDMPPLPSDPDASPLPPIPPPPTLPTPPPPSLPAEPPPAPTPGLSFKAKGALGRKALPKKAVFGPDSDSD